MSVTLPRLMLLACVLSPSLAWSLGLGEIHLNSALNEPMNAEIDLLAAAPEELSALRASLAGREAFLRYGIDRPAFLTTLTFKVGKSKDGRDALLVHSSEAIPEPFVTFLVEVSWARGRLMREYTVLLDPPVYTPGENAGASAPVMGAAVAPAAPSRPAAVAPAAPAAASSAGAAPRSNEPVRAASASAGGTYRVADGDTLARIATRVRAGAPGDTDRTMIALYRGSPEAFGGNINVLRRGAILRVPNADQIAALNQQEAAAEVHRQMNAWHGGTPGTAAAPAAAAAGHLRLVTPTGTGASSSGAGSAADTGDNGGAETRALKDRVKDLEAQLAESKRLIDIRSNELSSLQRKLGVAAPALAAAPATAVPPATAPVPPGRWESPGGCPR